MGLLDTILNQQGGAVVQQLGSQFGLDQGQVTSALSALVPALAAGAHQTAQTPGGLAALAEALKNGDHQKYINDPSTLAQPDTVEDGNGILGHLFGSKDVSRTVAGQAASVSGIDAGVLTRMLPMAATLLMGTLAQHAQSAAANTSPTSSGAPNLMGMLASAVGGAQSSGASGVVGMLSQFLGGRT